MFRYLIILFALAMTGCATSPYGTATSGGANYSYTKTQAGDCQITINSARDIAGGIIAIANDCTVTVTVAVTVPTITGT